MTPQLPADPTKRFFEHYPAGAVFEIGSFTVSERDIIDFARQYDPQDMHTDPQIAAAGPFGEVIASGWHTIGLMMRLLVQNFLPKNGLAAPGIDELRWPRPVRPGDTLRVRVTVLDARRSRSKPDRGLVQNLVEIFNQNDELVLSMKPLNMVRCRPDIAASAA
ncbi:MAG: MaoC family dehydratase [Acetobacteraceae bacterium]